MSCKNYDECLNKNMDRRVPIDSESLYADRLYDNQYVRDRCYQENPINIEGYGMLSMRNLFVWGLILLVLVVLAYMLLNKNFEETFLNVDTISPMTRF